ncbi:hypothetical protein H0H87_009479 [Tephrocybe sp. NHM501043]|nr:hypothetical protein H0H87_009479 [Tephrocybe sp. NHM501043]
MACMALPAFHTLGLYLQLLNPVYGIVSIALYPPTATKPDLFPVVLSPQNILDHTKWTRSTALIVIPTFLQIWAQSPEATEFLTTLSYVGFSGGSLAPKLGNQLIEAGVHLHPVYGGTEFGAPTHPISLEGKENWEYMRFQDRAKVRWVPQEDGTFECQFLNWENHHPMASNLNDVEGYATSDLFVPHPTREGLWKIVGRIDDVIVHSSGEKTVPAPMEDIITSSPIVQGALIIGREHDQAGILIEPKPEHAIEVDDDVEVATLRNKLWPIIEEANQIAPAYSKIFKEMILFTSDKKPLPRAGKGTVMRKAALALYEEEITALYATVESSMKTAESVSPPASWTLEDVQTWIVGQASDLVSGAPVSPLVNLFEQGFDSLSSTFLRLRIVGALRGSSHVHSSTTAVRDLPQNLVYSYPVIRDLATYVISLLEPEKALIDPGPQRSALIETMIEKYSFGLNASAATPALGSATSAVVLLTGSTGSIGTEILAKLLEDASVEHIYAFNRPSLESFTIEERHRNRFKESGLDIGLLNTEKVSFISGDATQPNLGLDRGQYSELSRSVTIVIHNAWKLDFNLSLSAFEPNVQSTRHLIDLLQSGPNSGNSRFLFTSSISSAQSWPKSNGPYPEEILMDPSSAIGNGYGEGKYVAERILAKSGVQATSIRIGQVSGGKPKGAWSVTDWVPILVKSSISIGVLPEIKGMISWIPMNVVASAIVEAALSDKILPAALNLVHPRPAEAIDIVRSLQSTISSYLGHHLNIVSFPEWLQTIEKRVQGATAQTLTDIPAIKLLDFFRSISQGNDTLSSSAALGKEAGGLPSFSIDKMVQASYTTLNEVEPIGINDASLWIKYWREIGFVM